MQVKIEKTFVIAAPADTAWRLLQDTKATAECMPGAQITEQVDERHYKGQIKFRIGPASAVFNGELEIKQVDPAAKMIVMFGKGGDTSGASAATMDLSASVREVAPDRSELVGISDVTVSGKFASFGGRMLTQVSEQILKQFGDNFAARALSANVDAAAPPAALAEPAPAPQAKELNGAALMWRALVAYVKSCFGGAKPARRE